MPFVQLSIGIMNTCLSFSMNVAFNIAWILYGAIPVPSTVSIHVVYSEISVVYIPKITQEYLTPVDNCCHLFMTQLLRNVLHF